MPKVIKRGRIWADDGPWFKVVPGSKEAFPHIRSTLDRTCKPNGLAGVHFQIQRGETPTLTEREIASRLLSTVRNGEPVPQDLLLYVLAGAAGERTVRRGPRRAGRGELEEMFIAIEYWDVRAAIRSDRDDVINRYGMHGDAPSSDAELASLIICRRPGWTEDALAHVIRHRAELRPDWARRQPRARRAS